MQTQHSLCADPWRVPTKEDIIDVIYAFGGENEYMMIQNETQYHAFVHALGWSAYGSVYDNNSPPIFLDSLTPVWSASNAYSGHLGRNDDLHARMMICAVGGRVLESTMVGMRGYAVRCVR
jgi:hypothetical protein